MSYLPNKVGIEKKETYNLTTNIRLIKIFIKFICRAYRRGYITIEIHFAYIDDNLLPPPPPKKFNEFSAINFNSIVFFPFHIISTYYVYKAVSLANRTHFHSTRKSRNYFYDYGAFVICKENER